ncbi:MAG TPA: RNA polymerase sigma-70 factor [Actinopolymorphaceae bacterium]|nr:RNA polymerase sigma-70 factor [Actinopolymorphaceae bacterium]
MTSSPDQHDAVDATDVFGTHRDLLFGVAYRVLGRVVDAEDVVQDAWLRWREVDNAEILDPRAYLVTVTTRLALDRLRSAQHRRETYVGPWLPEPILTSPDVADSVALTDSVSIAMLVVLETLSPLERAVFVLREAFAFSYAEIGRVLDRGEEAVRQLAHRARRHVQDRKPRYDADRATQRRVTESFLAACLSGNLTDLMELLAPDVTLHADGGGMAKAPRRLILGADKVGRFLTGIGGTPPPAARAFLGLVNGRLGIVITSEGSPYVVISLDVAEGRIATVRLLANPEKLSAVGDIARTGIPIDMGPG